MGVWPRQVKEGYMSINFTYGNCVAPVEEIYVSVDTVPDLKQLNVKVYIL